MPRNLKDLPAIANVRWFLARFFMFLCFGCQWWSFSCAQEVANVDADDDLPNEGAVPGALPRMNRAQLEEYMYGSLGGSKAAFQKTKRESIRRELDRVHSICSLSDHQLNKLNEAIEVDIQHIETRINSMLSGYDTKMTPQTLQEMQSKVWQFASTIQSEKVDKNLVWHKVLMSQLTKEQTERIKADEEKKIANQLRTDKLRVLLSLQRKLGLNAKQRAKVDEWLNRKESRELNFVSICKELAKSSIAAEVLRVDQIQSLQKITPNADAFRINPNQVLPAMDDLFR